MSLLGPDRLAVLTDVVASVAHLPGDLAELGVYRGGSARAIHEVAPHRRLHLFDTFTGLPDPDPAHDAHRNLTPGRFACDLARVAERFLGAAVTIHAGRFPDSVAGLVLPPLAFVHVDGDLYQTTRDALTVFWPILVPGGVMVFDDYGLDDTPGVALALDAWGDPVDVLRTRQAIVRKPA